MCPGHLSGATFCRPIFGSPLELHSLGPRVAGQLWGHLLLVTQFGDSMCAPALGPTLWYPRLGTHSALLHWGHPLFINFGPFPFACELMRKKKSALPIDFQANFIFQKQKGNFLNKKKQIWKQNQASKRKKTIF